MRILIVEGEQILGDALRDLCDEFGHRAATVRSAEEALAWLQGDRPDLIVLDVRLPGMSGVDFLRLPLVRSTRIPIIVVSGSATESQARECLELGAVNVLPKPLPFDQLRRLLGWFERPARPRPPDVPEGASVERRRVPRARVALPIKVAESDDTRWETTSVDLSNQAVKVRSAGTARPGPTVEITFATPGEADPVRAVSLLIRVDADGWVFYFLNLTEDHFERLTYLVHRLTASQRIP
jgi:DNA-binding response OmpR family regulator